VGPAQADGPPIVIPVVAQFQDLNPCTGELDENVVEATSLRLECLGPA
jgi:hypothetical protein